MSDDIESLIARSSELSKKADTYSGSPDESKSSGMFSGMGAMGGGMMTPGFLAAPQKLEPAPEQALESGVEEPAFDDFSKEIRDKQKKALDVVSRYETPPAQGTEKTDFPTIDAAKNWALESIEKGAEAISFGSDKPTPDALTSQLHQLSPSNITPEIKAEAAAVMDPVQLKQWPAWFTKTDAQHRAEFDQKHVETSMAEKGKEAWNVGVGVGKGLLDVGARFGSGVAKAGATFLKGPGTEGSITDPEEWKRWGTGIAKLATVPAVSVAESLESVVQTASNAFQNGLSATDWVNEQLPVEQGGITREEAFQNYLGRKRADEYYAGWRATDPNVFTRVIMEDPKTRELAENMAYSLTSIWSPSVDDRIQRHNGDRDAAMREKQLDDLRDSQQLVSNFRKEAAQMVPDPDLTEAAGWTRFGMNPFDIYGRVGGAGMRGISKGIKAASRVGKTAEQIAAMEAEAAAKAFEAELKAAEAAKTPGWVEGLAGKVADKVEPAAAWMSARYSDLPESVQEGLAKMGSGMVGTPLTKTAAILANAGVAAPRIAQAALAGRRLAAGGVEGGFEAGAKAATEAAAKTGLSPKAQQWLANKSIPAAKTLDWMAQNSMEMARGSVHGATLAAAVGVLENKDIEEIADMMGQGIFLHLGGEVMGNMTGVSHGRYMGNLKRQRASAAKWFNELDPATQAHVRDLGNWDSYVKSLKGLRDSAENKYAQRRNEADNVVYSGESPEKIQAAQEKANDALIELNIRNAQVRNAEKANSDTQKMYRDNLNIGMADVMTALNGSSKAGRNVEMRFTTADELAREVLANNRDKGLTDLELIELFNFVAGASGEFAFIAENGGKHTLTSGKTVDLYTPYKDRININIDSIKARMGSGESALNAFGHEAGHAFWNIKEFREGAAETYKELFGNQKFDERGNLIGGDPGLFSVEDLLNKFKDYYARGYDIELDPSQLASMTPEQQKAEAVKRLAQKIGLWDPVIQELDPNKTAAYMRHEMMAELIQGGAQGGIKLGADPKPWLAPLVDWATVKQKNTKTGKKIRNAFGLTESAPWDSALTGTRFSAEQVESTRNALRAVSELNGDVAAAEIIPHAPITETQLRSNEAVANQFGEAFFAHEKVATVLDKDGNVIESRVVTDPNAMEGTFEHGVTETGDPELRQTAGYGPIPAETHAMPVPEGGRVTITSRIKRDASGGLASLTPDQAKALNKARANIIRKAILDAPDREYPGRMDAVSADGLSLGGRLSPKQIEAIKGLPETIIPFGLKRRILEFNDLLVRDDGDAMIGLYGQAMDRQGRYKSFAPKIVDFVPLGMRLSKDGNILFNMFSKTGMREKLRRWQRDTPELLSLWNGDGESFMGDVRKVLENWKPREGAPAGLPGETGLDADLNMAISKKNRVNDFLNIFRKTEPESLTANPARTTMRRPARRLTKAEKLDEESSDPNTLIRSYRVDRFHDLEKSSDAPFRVNYGKALYNLMPAKSEVEQRAELPPAFEESILKGLRSINAFYMGSGAPATRLPLDSAETFVTRFKPRQNEEDAMVSHGFYSKAGAVLLDKMPNRASAAQLKGILDPQKGSGVKPEELKWSGINQFIDATQAEKGFVTKDDIRKWLKEDYAAEFATQTEFGDLGGTIYDRYNGLKLVLPNGENYKEVVLKVPGTGFRSTHFSDVPDYVAHLRTAEHGTGLLIEEAQSDLHQKARERGYKEPIPVEELLPKMESDLADLTKEKERLFEQYKQAGQELRSMPGVASELTESQKERVAKLREFQNDFEENIYEVNAAIEGVKEDIAGHKTGERVTYRGSVPDAPFRKDWPLQLFKYALKDAVESDKEWVGWTGGKEQAKRYKMSSKIDELAVSRNGDTYLIAGIKGGSRVASKSYSESELPNVVGKDLAQKIIKDHKAIEGYDPSNGVLRQRMVMGEPLPGMENYYDFVDPSGRVIQDLIFLPTDISRETMEAYLQKQFAEEGNYDAASETKQTSYSGLDLDLGGEGMKGFYDIMLPKEIGKYVKQWGAKVEQGTIEGEKEYSIKGNPYISEASAWIEREGAENTLRTRGRGEGGEIVEVTVGDAPKIWKIAITPEMRESVAGGQTRFMPSVAVVPERFTGTGEEEQRRGRYVEPPKAFKRFDISQYEPGGKFFDAETGEDLTNKSYENASIAVVNGKPMLVANNEAETTGTGPLFRTNLFKQKAGWKWVSEGAPDTSTIVSVEGQGKHLYALQADFQNGVKMARYEGKTSEPRLRPTGRGELTMGEQIGTIDIRGREHPVYDRVTIGAAPEPMEAEVSATRFMPEKEGALEGIELEPKDEKQRAKKNTSLRVRMTREALTDAALSQENWRNWYNEHQETLDDFFGKHAGLFQNILAITSQAASVKANVGLGLKAFGQLMRGEDFDGYLPAVAGNLAKLRDETGPGGQKIQAFTAANEGDTSSVVVDRHISRMLFGVDTPSAKQFAKASKVLTEVADKIGWTPAQVQAALWAHSIVQSGKQPESYGSYLRRLETQGGITKRIGGFGEGGAGADVVGGTRGRYSPDDAGSLSGVEPFTSVGSGEIRFMPSKKVAEKENDMTKAPVTEAQKKSQRLFVQSIVPANVMAKSKGIPSKIPQEYMDKPYLPIMADLLGGGGKYRGVEMQGGPIYPVMNYDGESMTGAWASTREGVESILGDLVKTGSIWTDDNGKHWAIVMPFSMSQEAHKANKNFGRVFMQEVAEAVKSGQVSPADAALLEQDIRNIKGKKVGLSEFPGFTSSNIDSYFSGLSFESRAAVVDVLKKKESQEKGVPVSERTIRETRDASYHGIDSGNLLSMLLVDIDRMAEQVPIMKKEGKGKDAKEVDTGETKWKLRDNLSAADLGVPEHLTYNTVIPGKIISHFQTPVPFDVGMPDPITQIKEYVAKNKPAKIQEAQGDLDAKKEVLSDLQIKFGEKYSRLTDARDRLTEAKKLLQKESAKKDPSQEKIDEYNSTISSLTSAIKQDLKGNPNIEKTMLEALEDVKKAETSFGAAERYDIRPDYAYQGRIPAGIKAQQLNQQVLEAINDAQDLKTHPAVARAMAAAITDQWTTIAGQKTLGMTEFLHSMARSDAAETLTQYDPKVLKDDIKAGKMSLYTLPENDVWFGLKAREDGGKELVGVMNNSGLGGMLNLIMAKAIQEGATNLDCYGVSIAGRNAELLPSLYARHGFVETGRDTYDKKYLADTVKEQDKKEAALKAQWYAQGWDGQKMPDLVYMKYDGIRTKPAGDQNASSVFAGTVEGIRGSASGTPVGIRGAGSGEAGGQMPDSGAATGSPVGGGKLLARGIDTFVQELGTATPDQLRTLGITPELARRILDAVSSGIKY